MNAVEFSNEFDIYYNNVTSNQAPPLDEYEKSVFLTNAQEAILKSYFNPKGNQLQEGFDDSQKRQIDFSSLVVTKTCEKTTGEKINRNSTLYKLPDKEDNIFQIVLETLIVNNNGVTEDRVIVPIHYMEYSRLMNKPYKQPLKNQAWRLISRGNNKPLFEIITRHSDEITKYSIRYVKRPKPIILMDLEELGDDLSIQGITEQTDCELDPIVHKEILERAVAMAKIAYETMQSPQQPNE